MRAQRFIIGLSLILGGCASGSHPARAADDPAVKLDIRGRVHRFTQDFREKQWTLEDKWLTQERAFYDETLKRFRDQLKIHWTQAALESTWEEAKKSVRERRRQLEREMRQTVRAHREGVELDLLKLEQKLDSELKDFAEGMSEEIDFFKKEDFYSRAKQDLQSAKDELKSELRSWKERLKGMKVKETFWE